jgi:hypothetical protein
MPDTAPDAALPDTPAMEGTAADTAQQDGNPLDLAQSDLLDLALTDVPLPDLALPDAPLPDAPLPDLAPPDTAPPDLALPDAGGCTMDSGPPSGVTVNYRSIGTNSGTLYASGTVSVSSGSTVATLGGGASLPSSVGRGDRLTIGSLSQERYILRRDSATQLTLQTPSSGSATGASYAVTRAYNSLQAWENDRDGNLVAENRLEVGVCYNDGPLTSALVVDGSITDATRYMHLTVAPGQRHSGKAGAGAVLKPAGPVHAIEILDPYTRVEWLEITDWGTNTSSANMSFDGINIQADQVLVSHVIVHHDGGRSYYNPDCNGIAVEANVSATVRNSIVHNIARSGISIHNAAGASLTVQSCTVWSCTEQDNMPEIYGCVGIHNSNNAVLLAENVIAMDAQGLGLDFFVSWAGAFNASCRNNLSSDSTAPGIGALTGQSAANQFEDLTSAVKDLHLKAGSNAIGTGVDLSSLFCDDIDSQARPVGAGWEIGADERLP